MHYSLCFSDSQTLSKYCLSVWSTAEVKNDTANQNSFSQVQTSFFLFIFFFPGNSGEITSAPKGLRNFFGWCFQPKYYRLCQFLIWHLAELMVCVNQFLSPCSSAVLNANGANRPHLPQQETVINGMSNKTVTIGNCTFPFRTSSVGKCMKLFTLCKRCWEQDLVSEMWFLLL